MLGSACEFVPQIRDEEYDLKDYEGSPQRWCPGCGDNGILTAIQRICRDEQLVPEKTMFVSGIGCSSRFPHYMKTYGFHGLHGRALTIAQGIVLRRPDLDVFVNMGDGDCCSIGTAHWIHAIRFNMNMMVMLHDNSVYGLTKMQVSPTSPKGFKSNTSPFGSVTEPLNPLSVTLGIANVSFVAQTVEWMPEHMYEVFKVARKHKGTAFVRILQRCPHFTPTMFDSLIKNPDNLLMLEHEDGVVLSDSLKKIYKNVEQHDPMNLLKAKEVADLKDRVPLGILYRNPNVPCYEDSFRATRNFTNDMRSAALNAEFDKFSVQQ